MTRVVWTRPALDDVRGIREHIARDSARYARAVAEGLFAAVERLRKYPLSGASSRSWSRRHSVR